MYMPINPIGYSCIKKLQRDNLLHAYNEPINIYSAIEVQTRSAPQNDRLNLSFVKYIYVDGRKLPRNGQKWQLGQAGWGGYY